MVKLTQATVDKFNGEDVREFTWSTESGFSVTALSYGAIVKSIKVPDNKGAVSDVVLGFDSFQEYLSKNTPYFGAAVGRSANRIGGASFYIGGATYNVAKNIGTDHLHGGIKGFDKVNWKSVVAGNKVIFSYLSEDGEEGYPGDLITNITYEVSDDGTFHMEFQAVTTKTTVVNLTNHSYFNLAGHDAGAEGLYDHLVTINADKITETTSASIPTGRFKQVGGTPFDLRIATPVSDILKVRPDLFDDNFCVTNYGNKGLTFVSRVAHPPSGRYLEVYSNQPGVQFYTSNFLPPPAAPALVGKGGYGYRRHGAFCLETQNFPDAIHHENFPSPILKPGDVYSHKVVYKFGLTEKNEVFAY